LAPVTIVAETPYLLVISAAMPATTYAEFAAYARANKGKLNYASPGPATVPHLSGFLLNETMGAGMTHVPFRGNSPAILALLAGEVQMIVHSYGSIAPLFAAGKLRALAVGAAERLKVLPQVPTTAEAGVPDGAISSNWWALAAPSGTDADSVNRLSRAARAALAEPEVQKRFVEQGWIAGGAAPAEVDERLRREAATWKAIVAAGTVRYVGEAVALVVAETAAQAADAAELIDVEYEALPAVTLPDARASGAPKVWDEARDNVSFRLERGDRTAVERAFASAA